MYRWEQRKSKSQIINLSPHEVSSLMNVCEHVSKQSNLKGKDKLEQLLTTCN